MSYLDRLPTYLKKDEGYYKLLENLDTYITNTGINVIKTFVVTMRSVSDLMRAGKDINIPSLPTFLNVMRMILSRLDGSLRYYPTINRSDQNKFVEQLSAVYLNAIVSLIQLREDKATKHDLLEQFTLLYPGDKITILDGGLKSRDGSIQLDTMQAQLNIQLTSAVSEVNVFNLYYTPNINGVGLGVKLVANNTMPYIPAQETAGQVGDIIDGSTGIQLNAEGKPIFTTDGKPEYNVDKLSAMLNCGLFQQMGLNAFCTRLLTKTTVNGKDVITDYDTDPEKDKEHIRTDKLNGSNTGVSIQEK